MAMNKLKSMLPGVVLTLLCAVTGGASLVQCVQSGRAGDYTLTQATLLNGEAAQQVAHSLSKSGLAQFTAEAGRVAQWLMLRDLGPRVRQGCAGWLFLADELEPQAGGAAHAAARAAIVQHLKADLASRGVQLLVAVVPDKTRTVPDQLCGLRRSAEMSQRVDGWLAQLTQAGVPALTVEPALKPLSDGAFLRTDTHWSEAGAQAAAQAVATRLAALGFQTDSPQHFVVKTAEPSLRAGDLVRLAGLDSLPSTLQPATEWARQTQISEQADADGDLFGDSALPQIALVGTSYSRTSNFHPFLGMALKAKVGQFAKDGAEFSGSIRGYLSSPAFVQTPPRYLVWEIPERYIEAPLSASDKALERFVLSAPAGN